MNKFITKLAKLFLGISMAAGVGVAVSSGRKQASVAQATDVTINNVTYNQAYFTGFESATTGTNYQGKVTSTSAQTNGASWEINFGNFCTDGKQNGSNGAQVRIYYNKNTYGYMKTTSDIENVKAYKFSYKVSNKNIKFDVKYSTDEGTTWTTQQSNVTSTGTSWNTLEYTLSSVASKFRIQLQTTAGKPSSSNVRFSVDDVYFGSVKEVPQDVTISSVAISNAPSTTVTGVNVSSSGPTLSATPTFATGSGTPTWTWASDNEDAVQVSSSGQLKYVGNGTAHITATASIPASQGGSNVGTTTVTTSNLIGSSTNPMPASTAYSIANAYSGNANSGCYVYVTGVALGTPYANKSGQVSVDLDAGDSHTLQAYNIIGLSTDPNDSGYVAQGNIVVVKGAIIKYNSTCEVGYVKNAFEDTELISNIVPVGDNTITFDSDGGTDPDAITRDDDETFIFPGAGTKANYVFKGWSSDGGTTVYAEGATSPAVTGDIEYTAIWQTLGNSANPYSVAQARAAITSGLGVKDVYVTGIVSQIVVAYANSKISFNIVDQGSADTVEAYECTGSDAENVAVGGTVVVHGNLILFQSSTYEIASGCQLMSYTAPVVHYTVTYYGNGNTGGTVPSQAQYDANDTVTVTSNQLTKTGATFNGWNTSADGSGSHYASNSTFTITANVELYAEWIVTLDAITAIGGTVSGLVSNAGTKNWDLTNVTVTGTLSGVSGQDVSSYVDLAANTNIPNAITSEPMDVSITATPKSTVSGSAEALTANVSGTVTSHNNSSSLNPGNYYFKVNENSKYFTGTQNGTSTGYGTMDSSKNNAVKLKFSLVEDDTWTIQALSGTYEDYYLALSGGTTNLYWSQNLNGTLTQFLIEDGTSSNQYKIKGISSGRYFAYYNDTQIRFYASGSYNYNMDFESAKDIDGFSVYSEGANKNVLKGTNFDAAAASAAGFQARINYTDNTYDDVTSAATWSLDTSVVGTATLTVTYQEYTAVTISDMNIFAATIVSLTIDSSNAKTTGYYVGDSLNTEGLVITGVDSSNNEYSIGLNEVEFSPTTLNTQGTQVIMVTYTNDNESTATGSYSVSVAEFVGYSKVNSLADLTIGDSYVVGSPANNALMGGISGNNKYLDGVSASSSYNADKSKVSETLPEGVNVVTFVYAGENAFYMYDMTDETYYSFAAGKADTVKVGTMATATVFNASFTEGQINLEISGSTRVLGYNADYTRFASYVNNSTYNTIALYKISGSDLKTAATYFANNSLKMNDPSYDGDISTPNCSSNYESMKDAYSVLSDEVKNVFEYSSDYSAARERLNNWATANGEVFNYGSETPFSAGRFNTLTIIGEDTNTVAIIVIISMVSMTAIGGYFFLHKRKENI